MGAPITAFDVKTGQVLWNSGREFAKSQLLWADGKLIILDQEGLLAMLSVDRQGFRVSRKWSCCSTSRGRRRRSSARGSTSATARRSWLWICRERGRVQFPTISRN